MRPNLPFLTAASNAILKPGGLPRWKMRLVKDARCLQGLLFSFRQAQYAQVFPLKLAPFRTLFAGLDSTNKSATFLLFFSYLTLALSSPPCPLLHLFFYHKLSPINCLFSSLVLSGYNGSPDTCFSRGTMRLMSWSNGERYLPPLQSLIVSLSSYLSYPL